MTFANNFEDRYISQDYYENRTVEQTLDLGWELLSMFENVELKRIDTKLIRKYMPRFRKDKMPEHGEEQPTDRQQTEQKKEQENTESNHNSTEQKDAPSDENQKQVNNTKGDE